MAQIQTLFNIMLLFPHKSQITVVTQGYTAEIANYLTYFTNKQATSQFKSIFKPGE